MAQRGAGPASTAGDAWSAPPASGGVTATASRTRDRGVTEGRRVASRAAEETQDVVAGAQDDVEQVAATAAEEARQLSAEVKEQAERVTGEVVEQGRIVLDEARFQLEEQANAQVLRVGDTLGRLAGEIRSLVEGHPEEADTLRPYVSDASEIVQDLADRCYEVAEDIEDRGLRGLLEDLQDFARRRPGTFLLGAAAAGLGVGRAVRLQSDQDGPAGSGNGLGGSSTSRATTSRATTSRVGAGARVGRRTW